MRTYLDGFDRLVIKGRLPQLYSREGMNCYAAANHVRLLDFKKHAKEITRHVLAASLMASAEAAGRFRYLNRGKESKEEAARPIEKGRPVGLTIGRCINPSSRPTWRSSRVRCCRNGICVGCGTRS
jgi:hypothetical protein